MIQAIKKDVDRIRHDLASTAMAIKKLVTDCDKLNENLTKAETQLRNRTIIDREG